jgi:class 3 adenylate cyclase
VTFLFNDIEASKRLWEEHPAAMNDALAGHDKLLSGAVRGHRGVVFSRGGDGVAAVFARAADAVEAAIVAQSALQREPWADGVDLRVRMGLHTGEAEERDGDYFGPEVNRAARLMALAAGGQVLVSAATVEVARRRLREGVALVEPLAGTIAPGIATHGAIALTVASLTTTPSATRCTSAPSAALAGLNEARILQ